MNLINKINILLENYDIPEKTPISLIRESGDNFVYSIGEKQKNILRISKRLPIEDIKFEYELINYLSSRGVKVPQILLNKDKSFYSLTDNSVAVIFTFLNGIHINIDKDHLPTLEQAFNSGKALGELNNAGITFKTDSTRERDIFKEFYRVLKLEKYFSENFEGGKEFVEQVKQAIKFGKQQKEPLGIIHNDYRPSNVFFNLQGNVSGIIDFDWSCYGPIIKDLALAIVEWSFPDGAVEANFDIFDAFLNGYNSVAINKYYKNKTLFNWILFTTLSDASTYFCDLAEDENSTKRIIKSFMYRKYSFFKNISE